MLGKYETGFARVFGGLGVTSFVRTGSGPANIVIMRHGFTFVEILLVLVCIGILAVLALPRVNAWSDRWAVGRATAETALFYQRVRFAAVVRSATIRIRFSPERLTAESETPTRRVIEALPGPARYGVRLRVSRSLIRLYPNGLGLGAANTKLVFRRGLAAESLTVSRLGRLKRWR